MKRPRTLLLLAATLLLAAAPFPPECNDAQWRAGQSELIVDASVLDYREIEDEEAFYAEIILNVLDVHKGTAQDEILVHQKGHLGPVYTVPGVTVGWERGEAYRLQLNETPNGYELTCGVRGREEAPQECPTQETFAKEPGRQSVELFENPCLVPPSWEVVEEPAQASSESKGFVARAVEWFTSLF